VLVATGISRYLILPLISLFYSLIGLVLFLTTEYTEKQAEL
jgi:hypothetical protein